ncbi:efflux transporter outer membrane subunit [Trinickia terrae]|uniref:Efflux transporter outer membrane subunit n=1 Tax=Trinickia terrae TaxID=2571161 RepID=A0A4U1HLQ7_9BURK|nr:efflux transporter outer membrane subunit [Trinickia terrae]TKC80334.1 efflux transporter outer membrane subunit [Trinickia terrae]
MQSPVMKGSIALAFLAFSTIITGCASTGGIAPQSKAADPSAFDIGQAVRAADANAQWPAADWWRAYGDPQLNTLVEAASAGSPTLAAAQARVREALAIAGRAQAALAPQVNGSLSLQRQHWADNPLYYGPGTLANENTYNNTGTIGLSYHLDLWGGDENALERALDTAHAQAADARAAQLELEVNVVRAYVDLSKDYALLDIAKETLEQQKQLVALAHRRLAGGLGTQLEVSQTEAPVPEYERQIDALEESIALDRNQLAALLGKGPGAGDSILRPTLSLAAPASLPSTLPADLIGHRPDIVAARWTVAGEARGIDVAKAAFYPNINLAASLGGYAVGGPLFEFLRAQNGSWTAGPALSLPIFDGGALRSQLGAAAAGYDQAVENYNRTIVSALKDVSDQVVRMRSLGTQAQDAQRSVAAAKKSFDLSREGYRRGLTDYVNVIVAQTQWLNAQQGVARIQAEQLVAHASLMAALGGGLDDPANGPAAADTRPGHTTTAQRAVSAAAEAVSSTAAKAVHAVSPTAAAAPANAASGASPAP